MIKYHYNNFRSNPIIKNKDILDSYNKNMNYKKFSNKFELPKIIDKVPKIIGRNFDVEPYDRVFYNFNNELFLILDEKKPPF